MKFRGPAAFLITRTCVGHRQSASRPAAKEAIRKGGFERTLLEPNLWSGVDKD
jgi:hypothetical protein